MTDQPSRDLMPRGTDKPSPPVAVSPYGGYGHGYGYGAYYGGETGGGGHHGALTPARILRVLFRRWPIPLLAAILGVLAAQVQINFATPLYRASSQIEVQIRRPRIMRNEGAVIEERGWGRDRDLLETRIQKLQSRATAEKAVATFRELYPKLVGLSDDQLCAMVFGRLRLEPVGESRLMRISVEWTDPAVAAAAATAFARTAEKVAYEENRAVSDQAVAWLQAQAGTQRKLLQTADEAMTAFRASRKLDELGNEKKTVDAALLACNAALLDVENQQTKARDLLTMLDALAAAPTEAGTLPSSIPRAEEITLTMQRWIEAAAQKDALLVRYTENHPEVMAQERVIAGLRRQMDDAIARTHQTVAADVDLFGKQADSLRRTKEQYIRRGSDLEGQIIETGMRMEALQREREAADISYRGILNRIEEARVASDENTATITVLEEARIPGAPFHPVRRRSLLIGLMLGLLGGLGLMLVVDRMEDRISGMDDVEQGLNLKILGLIPRVPRASRAELARAVEQDPHGHLCEVFAGIRGMIETAQNQPHTRSVLIAGSAAEVGKSVVACNLAVTYALSGQKTLLVDFDLRRPRVARMFGVEDSLVSLMQVLGEGQVGAFPSLVHPSGVPNLDLAGSHRVGRAGAGGFAKVMSGPVVPDFLKWAGSHYERIIIDSPPIGVISDALVLAGKVGCVVFVCRPGKSRLRSTRTALSQLESVGARVMGAVINDIEFRRNPIFSNYDYGHYQDYYEGYGHYAKGSRPPETPRA